MQYGRMPLVIIVLVCAVALAGCGGEAAEPQAAASPAAATDAPAIGAPVGAATEAAAPAAATEAAATEAPAATEAAAATEATAAATTAAAGAAQATSAPAASATAGETLQTIRDRGQLICGVNDQVPGFGSVDSNGQNVGFDIDFCKALAAAVLGDANAVQYRPLTAQERFTALQSREVDVLIRNTTWTLTRDTANGLDFAPTNFFDGQGIMVRAGDNISSLEQLDGATICVQSGTTTELNLADAFRALNLQFTPAVFEDANGTFGAYDAGQCDAVTTDKSGLASRRLSLQAPDEHVILDVTLSKEPLAPSVLQGDPQWKDIVTWVVYGLINAEEYEVTTANVAELASTSEDPNVRRLLGAEGELGAALGLENDFMVAAISAVGNYGEIYERHLGPNTPLNLERGQNAQYTDGGLIYGIPFR
jgi:general L-amino acid transport system substrate-binding protein